jgi:murein DD-endopeptidase MepM/ murein hydrolase activator NlpD
LLHAYLKRASLVAALLCALLIPIASTAGPSDELKETRARLHSLRRRLTQQGDRATRLKQRINVLGRKMTRAQIAINGLDADIGRMASSVRTVQAQIDRMQTKTDTVKQLAVEQAVSLYKAGSANAIGAILGASSITELNDRIAMLGVAARENTGALVRYGRLRVAIEAASRALLTKQDALAEARAAQAEALAARSRLKASLEAALRGLSARMGMEKTREGHLEAATDVIKKRIVELQASSAARSLGTSAEGFIWPLNGPVTSPYGPRWGSMHTGIDIDGYTGQPIVAAKAGRVIYIGAGMTGYGNTVILDHGGGVSTLYAHMSGYSASGGASLGQGEVIGYVGCTGHCYGDHLHFEVRIGGNPVDPLDYLP